MPSEDAKAMKKEEVEDEDEINLGSLRKKKPNIGTPKEVKAKKVKKEEADEDFEQTSTKKTSTKPSDKKKKKKEEDEKKKKKKGAKQPEKIAMKRERKVYDLPGQKRDSPEERDPVRIFYETLYKQVPNSEMAAIWMMESGLLAKDVVPCASKSRFLTGSSGKLNREVSVRPSTSSSTNAFKVEAKKGAWLPGLASPAYLDGSLPGDNGFDPLGLAEDPENLKWFIQAELVNSRWAMLGVAGMLLPEVLTKVGIINAPKWFDAGKSEYFASSSTLFVIEFILFHYVEIRRWQDIKDPGCVNQDPIFKNYSLPPHECGYPGSIFNPLNFEPTEEAKEKELANGRLAMLAFLGFIVQHNVTGQGPFDNLLQHLSDPWHNTIIQTFSGN